MPPSIFFRTPSQWKSISLPSSRFQIAQVATKVGTAPERLVTDVVLRYLVEETRFLAAVEKGLAAAERGEFIDEKKMGARLEAMFRPQMLQP